MLRISIVAVAAALAVPVAVAFIALSLRVWNKDTHQGTHGETRHASIRDDPTKSSTGDENESFYRVDENRDDIVSSTAEDIEDEISVQDLCPYADWDRHLYEDIAPTNFEIEFEVAERYNESPWVHPRDDEDYGDRFDDPAYRIVRSSNKKNATTGVLVQQVSIDFDFRDGHTPEIISFPADRRLHKWERRRLAIYERSDYLRGAAAAIRARYSKTPVYEYDGMSVEELLDVDRHSLPSLRNITTARAISLHAAVEGVPREAIGFFTIDLAAVPQINAWLAAKGQHPRTLLRTFIHKLRQAARSVGAEFAMIEGFFEVAEWTSHTRTEQGGRFIRSWAAQNWPTDLIASGALEETVYVPHYHFLAVLVDGNGDWIPPDELLRALKKDYPHPRQAYLKALDDSEKGSAHNARSIREYALKKINERSDREIEQEAAWKEAVDAGALMTSGWIPFTAKPVAAFKRVLASVTRRDKIRYALQTIDVGPSVLEADISTDSSCTISTDSPAVIVQVHRTGAVPSIVCDRTSNESVVVNLSDYRRRHLGTKIRAGPLAA